MTQTIFYGVAYSPTWTTWSPPYSNTGANAQFSDSDFFNGSFQALWNKGKDASQNKYRDDLGTMSSGGFNLVRLYNWGPTRGWNATTQVGDAHIGFLNYATAQSLQVIVPISNYFLSDDTYAWNGQDPDGQYTFTSAPAAIQTALKQFLSSVTDPTTSKLHAAVHSFSVGNEIDINDFVGEGSSGSVGPTSRMARVLWWIINLREQIVMNQLGAVMLTSPISNADQGNPGTSPMSYWFGAFVNGVTATTPLPQGTVAASGVTTFSGSWLGLGSFPHLDGWYYNSVNIYQLGSGLTTTIGQYDNWQATTTNDTNWPGQQFTVPLMLTETGVTRASNDANGQQAQYTAITTQIAAPIQTYLTANPTSLLMGYCLYEFSDEVTIQANWGLMMVENSTYPSGNVLYSEATGSTIVSYATWPSTTYPVDQLFAVQSTSGTTLLAALKTYFTQPGQHSIAAE